MGSVRKAIKIFARLKPSDSTVCKYEVDKHINDDGTTDDILIINSTNPTPTADDCMSNSASRPDSYRFRFSKVFENNSPQDRLFEEMCQPVLDSALQGYNSTIFAYGQTSSGKTYTMTGSRQQWKNRGIIPRSITYVFDKFNELASQGYVATAFLSYLEIYNENGYDLLHSGFSSGRIEDLKKVQLLEDAQQQIHIKNLTVHPIKSEDEAMQLLYLGDHNRIIAETPMNEASTRSHCIFTIHLNIREENSSTVRRSKVHLVDLAGSERLANSTSTGQLFHESRHINLALHYLEQVIVALGEANRSHIPYRNSMMTSILRDSLGGNCMTSMVATLSLEQKNLMETLSTCRFSQRVALVQNAAMLNEETDPILLIAQLKIENRRLKEILANSPVKVIEGNAEPLTQGEVADCWRHVEKFMSEQSEEAVLQVIPDMRFVQTCFRCLKVVMQMNKEELGGPMNTAIMVEPTLTPRPEQAENLFLPRRNDPLEFMERAERYSEELTREQLVECLRIRDAEIDVLTKMLRPGSLGRGGKGMGQGGRFVQHNLIHGISGNHFEYGDGPQQQRHVQPQFVKTFREFGEVTTNRDPMGGLREGGDEFYKMPSPPIENGFQERFITPRGNDLKSNEIRQMRTTATEQNNSYDNDLGTLGELFDSDCLFIEGLSESKKRALDSFVGSYKGKERLERARDNLVTKRSEVDSIEMQLRRNHANLNNLKVVLLSSDGGGEDEDIFMREAVDVQSQSIQKQERQLIRSREEMRQIEEILKGLYAQLMSDFEAYLNRGSTPPVTEPSIPPVVQQQQPLMPDFRKTPSDSDFALGASAASVTGITGSTVPQQDEHPSPAEGIMLEGIGENGSRKPLSEMTKGIVKGVGGTNYRSHQQNYFYPSKNKSARSKSTNVMAPFTRINTQFSISPAPPQPQPCFAATATAHGSKSLSMPSGKDRPTPRGKYPPMNTPRSCRSSEASSPRVPAHSQKGAEVPPGTPAVNSLYSTQTPKGHQNYRGRDASMRKGQNITHNNNYYLLGDKDDDHEDHEDELLQDLPMTGDETIDSEILSFFRTRQAVFKQINNDRTTRVPAVGGGVLANYQQFSS